MGANTELAEILREIADLLDLEGERFKPEAYRRAARTLDSLTEDVRSVAARGELDALPGVGSAISEKIQEYLRTGKIAYHERIRAATPPGLLEIMRLPGIGPKSARRFHLELGVEGPAELTAAIDSGRLATLKGFGEKKAARIRKALAPAVPTGGRVPLRIALAIADALVAALRGGAPIDRIEVAGSFRRGRESVGDLDVLATSSEPERVFDAFIALPQRRETVLRGPTKATVLLETGLQVDLRVVPAESYGAALQYFTGSKDHNVRLRSLARDQGLKVNEYGVFRGDERVAGASEEDVYRSLGLAWIPPEIREDSGEIPLAAAGTLPKLFEPTDLRGDLHLHLARDAGDAEVDRLIAGARSLGWTFLGLLPEGDLDAARERWQHLGGPGLRVLIGEEAPAGSSAPPAPSAEYRVLRAGEGDSGPAPLADADVRPLLLGHLRTGSEGGASDGARVGPWIDWAIRWKVPLEIGASGAADGLDAATARQLLGRGGRLHLTTAGGDPAAVRLVTKTARRAWATREAIVNAAGPTGPRKAPARPRPSRK